MNKEVSVGDLEVRDVITDMAKILGVDYEETNNEICINLPANIGQGFIKGYTFDQGMGVLEMDFLLKKEMTFGFKKALVQPLKIIFNREQPFTHRFYGIKDTHEIRRLESAILSSNGKHWHVFTFPAKEPISLLSLEINRKLFEEKIENFLEEMNEDVLQLFRDVNGVNLFYHKGFYSLTIAKFLEEFTECDLDGFMRSVYLEGKTFEILTHHLQQFIDDLNEPRGRKILRQSTVKKIEEAVEIIKSEIDKIGNIPSLAKRVGLNQNTLQNGFKHIYKVSVNEYISEHRISLAKELIENSDLNITEVTYKIGINSRSYFSKLFKKKYGSTPKQYLDSVRNRKARSS